MLLFGPILGSKSVLGFLVFLRSKPYVVAWPHLGKNISRGIHGGVFEISNKWKKISLGIPIFLDA